MTPLKRHRFITFLLLFACLLLSLSTGAQRRKRNSASGNDSLKVDSTLVDTLSIDTVAPKKKQPLDAPVIYEANDSIVFTEGGYAHLYGDGKVNYEKIELTSAVITMNMDSSTVYARGVPDSVGVEKGTPIFKDGETPYESKIMRYNFKSKKGFINNIVTQQGEGYVTSEESKKGSNDELYLRHGRYTTCDNHEHPHFYLKLSMAKVRPKKNVVFGPAQLVVEDVPLPLAIPFGFFPFNSSYSSGFIMPTYGDEMNRGFYLRDGGYVFQFQELASSAGKYSDISKMISGTFLTKYSEYSEENIINAILDASKTYNISPFHITSRILQESGIDGGTLNGYIYNRREIYNLFNIGATGASDEEIIRNGAEYAYKQHWFTPQMCINGSVSFLKKGYFINGQSTLYFQKYNVVNMKQLYNNQYMQNIRAANDEGKRISDEYKASGLINSQFEFTIPVYENMPSTPCASPAR